MRFETAPGEQAPVDFAPFNGVFTDEPATPRIVWLFVAHPPCGKGAGTNPLRNGQGDAAVA